MCGFDDEQLRVGQSDAAKSMLLIATDELAGVATRVRMIAERFEGLIGQDATLLLRFASEAELAAQTLAGFAWNKCQPARPLVSEANGSSSS